MDSTTTDKMLKEIKQLREDKRLYMKLVALQTQTIKRIAKERDVLIQRIITSTMQHEDEFADLYWKFKGSEKLEEERASTESMALTLSRSGMK